MRANVVVVILAAVLSLTATTVIARGSHGHKRSTYASSPVGSYNASKSHAYKAPKSHRGPKAASGVKRDTSGKIHRSATAKNDFKKSHPCPSTGRKSGGCPGYVIDHVKALKRGGADAPSNMQWQTKSAAKAKDTWE